MFRLIIILLLVSVQAVAGKDEVLAQFRTGRYMQVAAELEELAGGGDARAMIMLGNLYYAGRFGDVDYARAHDWWYRAWLAGDAEALPNLAVLYRDGAGVQQNLRIAYALFVLMHLQEHHDATTLLRNGSDLENTVSRLDAAGIRAALCYSEDYVRRYLAAHGAGVTPTAPGEVRLRDRSGWPADELPDFVCSGRQDDRAAR